MHPRARRLLADAEMMRTEFAGHPYITVEPLGWDPPEQYRVTYRLLGVRTDPTTGQPVTADTHTIVISLPAAYPREKPYSTAQTPVFHPNFGPNAGDEICIGDYWTPSQTLADIVVKVGEMLQFREYNVRSPLNAVAARWVAENESIFPIGDIGLYQAEPEISLGDATTTTDDKMELTLDDDGAAPDDAPDEDAVVLGDTIAVDEDDDPASTDTADPTAEAPDDASAQDTAEEGDDDASADDSPDGPVKDASEGEVASSKDDDGPGDGEPEESVA